MTRHRWVLAGIVAAAMFLLSGCDDGASSTTDVDISPDIPVERWVSDLTAGDPGRRAMAATELGKVSAEQLKPHVAKLEAAVKKARDPNLKASIQALVEKAGG